MTGIRLYPGALTMPETTEHPTDEIRFHDGMEYRLAPSEAECEYREHLVAHCEKITPEQLDAKLRGLCLCRPASRPSHAWMWTVARGDLYKVIFGDATPHRDAMTG
jgi:hypothetical protein